MGYRIYLGAISNKKLNKIKNVSSSEELYKINNNILNDDYDKEDCYCGVYNVVDEEHLHEFGKYIEWTEELKNKYSKKIFKNKEFNKEYTEEHDFFIINKDGLKYIIEDMANDMTTYYKKISMYFDIYEILNKKEFSNQDKEDFDKIILDLKSNRYYHYDFDIDTLEKLLEDEKEIQYIKNKIHNEIYFHFKDQIREFDNKYENLKCYNLDETKKYKITNSWYKDKGLLELVHILKTFDFKHNKLVIYGY